MTVGKIGIGVACLGALSLAIGLIAGGGLGSCGFYGSGTAFLVGGTLLLLIDLPLLAGYGIYRAVQRFRR